VDIAVVIPTYNRYTFLQRALRSVFAQTLLAQEVIVVDDGSTDATQNILEEFPSIKYIYQTNQGVSAARNRGIIESSCEWITFLDSDDCWMPSKLQKHKEYHRFHSEIFMSCTQEQWIRNSTEISVAKRYRKTEQDLYEKSLLHCVIAPSSVCIHHSVFDKVGMFDPSFEVCEDYDLWLRIANYFSIGVIEEKLITKYGGHEDQLSFKHWGMDRFRVRALEKLLEEQSIQYKREDIVKMLLYKYKLLWKGAKKYNKTLSIKKYEDKIAFYENL